MKWLNFHHLYYFRAIATEGGLTKAAKKLRLGESALSIQLKQLEENLGKKLFERKNRTLVLTESGKLTLSYCNDIFKLGDLLVESLQRESQNKLIQFNFGVLGNIPKVLSLKLSGVAIEQGVEKIKILEDSGEALLEALLRKNIDLVLVDFPALGNEPDRLLCRSIGTSAVGIYGHPSLSFLKNNFPKSLSQSRLVLPTFDCKLRQDLEIFLKAKNLKPKIIAETQDTSIQKMLGTEGVGLLPLPEIAAIPYVKEKKLIKIGDIPIKQEFWIIALSSITSNSAVFRIFQEFSLTNSMKRSTGPRIQR